MVCETKTLGVGRYTTRDGREAVVDAVVDTGVELMLVGRVIIGNTAIGQVWLLDGKAYRYGDSAFDIGCEVKPLVKRTYWLNIYDNGPGLLRETWEQSLVEASREEKQPLCRVEVKVEAFVGDGLR
jgi:hypothetical protein